MHSINHFACDITGAMKRGIDYIGVGVGAIIVDGKGRLFLAKRGEKAKDERGLWEFPGGAVEFGIEIPADLTVISRANLRSCLERIDAHPE